ncbi:MAG: hypothetical protein S4CHLAM2_11280 [Chlamydiales bacterium]|nr:hypothetical protein [Chlamydiales bacterium]
MKKRLGSTLVRWMREGVKKGCAGLSALCLRSRSYSVSGIPAALVSHHELPTELYPQVSLPLTSPQTVDLTLSWQFRVKTCLDAGGGFFSLSKAVATSLGGNLNSRGELISTYLKPVDGRPLAQHDLFKFSTKRFFPKIYHTEKPVVTLTAGWQNAFYHWMYEVLPRIHLVEKSGDVQGANLYVAAGKNYQKASLGLLGVPKERIINAGDYDAISTPHLLVPSTPTLPTSWGCQFLRDRILPQLKKRARTRLYVSRRDADKRRVVNEEEVYALLQQYGFERVELADRPLREQMELFHAAEMVVGPHGAGFSHLVFCHPGTPFLEFFHPGYVNVCYWHLSNVTRHPYYYLFGEGKRYPDGVAPPIDPDITLDLAKLKQTLEMMLNDFDR